MTLDEIKAGLTPVQTLALTLWAEARGEGLDGMTAVGCVIRNRAANPGWWGHDLKDVCLRRGQFSCWNPGTDPNHRKLMAMAETILGGHHIPDDVNRVLGLAWALTGHLVADTVLGSDHYYAPAAMVPKGAIPPWAKDKVTGLPKPPTMIVGRQWFYKLGLTA